MYSVGLVLDSGKLLAKFTSLHVWGEETDFQIEAVCTTLKSLQERLKSQSFELIIVENNLAAEENYRYLKKLKDGRICAHIALCSEDGDFEAARKGIRLGIDDYFTLPLKDKYLLDLFERITSVENDKLVSDEETAEKLVELFQRRDDAILEYIEEFAERESIDAATAKLFELNDWFDLYFNEADTLSEYTEDFLVQKNNFINLYKSYLLLNPNHNEILDKIFEYILYNPESDLRQKSLSEELRINKSYLSTVFIAQTNIRFVDYITYVKLIRAGWLLKNTDMKIGEIAKRLDYKDVAYFSKQFKKQFSIAPSEYRLPDEYHFEI